MAGNLFGNSKKTINAEIQSLSRRINDNKEFQRVELPALQEIKSINDISHRNSEQATKRGLFNFGKESNGQEHKKQAGGELAYERAVNTEIAKKAEESLTDICLKVCEIR